MSFHLKCSDFLHPGCAEEITGETGQEALDRARQHAADVHADMAMTPERIEAAQARMVLR